MEVRYDPRDLSRIYLRAPDGDYYDVSYRDLRRPPISLSEYQLAIKHLHKIKHAEVGEEAIFRAVKTIRGRANEALVEPKYVGRSRTSGQQQGSTKPLVNSSPNRKQPAGRQDLKKPQPWRRMLTVEEWS